MTQRPLDPARLETFWRFVAARQRVWVRRVVHGADPPWTDDVAIRERRFTNVYRRLDPGTTYAISAILDREAPTADRLFNLLAYRLIGRVATHAHVGFLRVEAYEAERFAASLRARGEAGEPVFTGAYLVSGYAGVPGADKIEKVARLLGQVAGGFGAVVDDLETAAGPREAFEAIRSLPGFGTFLAYQVLVDASYPSPSTGEPLLPVSLDTWAAAGPGARRGLALLGAADDLEAMRWLAANQVDEVDRLGIAFDWLRDASGTAIRLSLADVQNCCCEFSKYHRVRSGDGRGRRRFRPEERRSAAALREKLAPLDVSVDPADYPG